MAERKSTACVAFILLLLCAGAGGARAAEGFRTQNALEAPAGTSPNAAIPDGTVPNGAAPNAAAGSLANAPAGTMPGTPGGAPGAGTAGSGYRLGPGDEVRVIVFGQPDLSGVFRLDGAGLISMPLINNVDARGLSASELEKRIVAKLTPNYLKNANASVDILSYRPFYIVGEVSKPGSYAYVNGMTALNAVALAGGFTYRADEDDFEIKRTVDGKVSEMDAGPETEVQPGDVITVDERWF